MKFSSLYNEYNSGLKIIINYYNIMSTPFGVTSQVVSMPTSTYTPSYDYTEEQIQTAYQHFLSKDPDITIEKVRDAFLEMKKVPQCMREKKRLPLTPDSFPLRGDQLKWAVSDLLKTDFIKLKFPRVMKLRKDEPIAQQNYGLYSFTPAKGAKADNDGCYGVIKIRGTFATEQEAKEHADRIIGTMDARHEIFVVFVGSDAPLAFDDDYCKKVDEIDIKAKLNGTERHHNKEVDAKDQQEMKEIKDREQAILAPPEESKDESSSDMEEYIKLRIKRANAIHVRKEAEKTIARSIEVSKKSYEVLKQMDLANEEFKNNYKEIYLAECKKSGITENMNPLVKYLDYDEEPTTQ